MVNFNGNFFEESTLLFDGNNRAFKYGDGLFETIRIENNHIYFLEDHYFRLMASMRVLRMEIPMDFTLEFFQNQIKNSLLKNTLESARVRFSVFRKAGGLYNPIFNEIDFLIETKSLGSAAKLNYEIDIFKDFYVSSDFLSTLKTNNRLINVISSIYANENGLDNCVLLNEKKNVVEASNGSIFVVFENCIKTPPLTDGCIKGIVRKKILELKSHFNDLTFEEISISPFDLLKADEVFITNSIVGIQSVTKYKKVKYSQKVTDRIKEVYATLS